MGWAVRNIFQRLIRHWEKLHPYNGAQALRVVATFPGAGRLETIWNDLLVDAGLGRIKRRRGGQYRFVPPVDASCPVAVLPPETDLAGYLGAGVNEPFRDRDVALRPFVIVPGSPGGHWWMGVVYRHWAADSVAVRLVLRHWLERAVAGDRARVAGPRAGPRESAVTAADLDEVLLGVPASAAGAGRSPGVRRGLSLSHLARPLYAALAAAPRGIGHPQPALAWGGGGGGGGGPDHSGASLAAQRSAWRVAPSTAEAGGQHDDSDGRGPVSSAAASGGVSTIPISAGTASCRVASSDAVSSPAVSARFPRIVDLPTANYRQLFGPTELGGPLSWSLLGALCDSARQTSRMKRVRRIESDAFSDYRTAFLLCPTDPGTLGRVTGYARRAGVKVNDVLLAALGLAVDRHGPLVVTSRRQDLALGTIVDLRPYARTDLSRTFGFFLGFTTVFLRPAHCRSLHDAVLAIARQQAAARAAQAAPASMMRMAAGVLAHRATTCPRAMSNFYRKRVPLSAGISNVNLQGDGLAAHYPQVLTDVVRVSPTGPMMPLVISATTLADTLHFGLTYRTAVVPPDMAQDIADDIRGQLQSL